MINRPIHLVPPDNLPAVEILITSLCYLMTQYAREFDSGLVPQIQRHLHLLEKHPDCSSDLLRTMCRRLSGHWQRLVTLHATGTARTDQFIH